jgi:small-conductance mechanosensitive channel
MPNPTAAAAPSAKAPLHVSVQSMSALWSESTDWLLRNFVQIGIALAIGAGLVGAMLLLRRRGRSLCDRQRSASTLWPQTIARVVTQTQLWFMVLFAAKLVDGYADPPPTVASTITALFTIAAAIQGAIWVRELILAVVEHRAGGEHHAALSSAIGIIRLLVTVVLYAVALVLILDNLGVNVTGLIAGLGIGGIAIGLAAKGIFDDLFSALSIIFDRPFQRGDSIQWDKTSGSVETIGLKTTRVRSVTGEEVVISNTNLLNKELHNLTRLDRRRTVVTLSIAAYTPPDVCATLPALIRKVVEAHDKCKLVRCGLTSFGASSLDFELQYDVGSKLYDEVFNARHTISVALLRAFADAGIDWAWPTQATIVASADGRPSGVMPVHSVAKEEMAAAGSGEDGPPAPTTPPMPDSGEIAPE